MKKDSSVQHAGLGRLQLETMDSDLPDKAYRSKVLQLLLFMTAIFGAFFGSINWQSYPILGFLELIMALYSVILFPLAKHEHMQFKLSVFFLLPLYSLFLFALIIPREIQTAIVWILVIPVLSYFLLGRRFGLWISVIFMSLAGLASLTRSLFSAQQFDALIVTNQALAGISILVFSHIYEVSRVRAHKKLLHLATTDNLTSLANRARFLDVFERERNHAARNKTEMSLLLLDLDHFKQVNDRYGHDIGDEVLKYVAATISHRLRKTDLACRLGGEEFGILLPGANLDRALTVAEVIRKTIADIPYAKGPRIVSLSVSIGAAEYGYDGLDLESLYAVADGHLYKAKAGGRNQVRHRTQMRNVELDLALVD
jgi:diguanylate cyclase (GGDEF)-like protein